VVGGLGHFALPPRCFSLKWRGGFPKLLIYLAFGVGGMEVKIHRGESVFFLLRPRQKLSIFCILRGILPPKTHFEQKNVHKKISLKSKIGA
jgi:hypothetical protein